jgi:hypothetical protein
MEGHGEHRRKFQPCLPFSPAWEWAKMIAMHQDESADDVIAAWAEANCSGGGRYNYFAHGGQS